MMVEPTDTQTDPALPASRPTPLGIYDKPRRSRISSIELIAIILSVLWLVGAAAFFFLVPRGTSGGTENLRSLQLVMTILAVCMPIAMIWVAASAARASKVMREESQRLQGSIDAIRQAYIAQSQGRSLGTEPSVNRKLDEIAAAARKTETTLATFTSQRKDGRGAPPAAPAPADTPAPLPQDQPALALGTPVEEVTAPLPTSDFIRALNFPETAEDEEGFTALRRALKDRSAGQLITAAQDVLTLMSQDGIYMDDLRPDRARPEVWRAFAQGERGRAIASLGGIRDRSSLALTAGRMKQDPIFRDAAHHFLRKFDTTISAFEPLANDTELSALAETRTARAFMLLGRVAGTFD